MAQHDYVIDNSTGANVRADINNALLAISSNNSGTSAPSTTYAFQLYANTSTGMLQIRNAANSDFIDLIQLDGTFTLEDGSASAPALAFRDDLNTGIFSSAADTFNISTGGTQRMSIESNGDIVANFNGSSQTGQLNIADGSASSPGLTFWADGSGDTGIFRNGANTIGFSTGGTQRMFIDASGDVTVSTGNLVVGTSGKGIDFSATSDATGKTSELFDDYEEGTWTPTPTAGSFTSATGRYTKSGRIVVATFAVVVNTDQGASFFQFNGLPFDNVASNAGENLSSFGFTDSGLDGNIVGTVFTGTAIIFTNFSGTNYRYNTSGVSGKIFRGGVTYMSSV